jgi:hypothetical protein
LLSAGLRREEVSDPRLYLSGVREQDRQTLLYFFLSLLMLNHCIYYNHEDELNLFDGQYI